MESDLAIADLLSNLSMQYRERITDDRLSKNKARMEIIRKLELITQSIRGLMQHNQSGL